MPGHSGRVLDEKQPRKIPCTADVSGRGERIRTSGLHVPNVALYQTEPHPEIVLIVGSQGRCVRRKAMEGYRVAPIGSI